MEIKKSRVTRSLNCAYAVKISYILRKYINIRHDILEIKKKIIHVGQ